MKVTQEKLPASQIGLEIEITSEASKKAYDQVIEKFTRSATIPGFRKGKVPRQVVIQRYGTASLKAAALEELIDDTIKQALEQEKIDALGNFQLRSSFEELVGQFQPGSSLIFSASVDVQPEVKLDTYQGFELQAEEVNPDPDRVDKTLQEQRDRVATLVPVEGRSAQLGDTAIVDFQGVLPDPENPEAEPEPFTGGQAEDFQVELKEDLFIPGFVAGMVGLNPGETKEISVAFPEEYSQASLAGRPAIFTVTLKELKAKELPELDDDFAQEVSEFETLAELRETLEKRYVEEAEEKTRANKEQAIVKELANRIEVELPETLIERELSFMLNQTAMQLQNQGIDVKRLFNQDTIAMMKERSRPDAIERIKRTLALGEVAKQESITVEPEAVSAKVSEILSEMEDQDIDRNRLQEVVSEDLLKEKIVDWLIEHSTIELVPEGTLAPAESEEVPEAEFEEVAASEATVTVESEAVESVESEVVEPEAKPEAVETAGTGAETEVASEPESPEPKAKKSKAKG
ncbi:MAG TPA: trigger factor [Thermosynechococcaceae cyanobacterium]